MAGESRTVPRNPLRDPRDRRLTRIAGPSALVLFGVTGDLAKKKLLPAMYDLAQRGLLPPAFSLVGFGRRDWSDEEFADYVRAAVRNPSSYYVWGGNGPSGFDCSGLTQQAMAQAGISIPRRAGDQYLAAKSYVPISQAQPGDLVFYANQSTGRIYHAAMYMGGGQLAHALNEDAGLVFTSTTIMKSDMLAVAARY